MSLPNDDTEVVYDRPAVATQPPSIDPATLRRAMNYGQKCATKFPGCTFAAREAELQAGWLLKGEAADWEWVRGAVRLGFEQAALDEG